MPFLLGAKILGCAQRAFRVGGAGGVPPVAGEAVLSDSETPLQSSPVDCRTTPK